MSRKKLRLIVFTFSILFILPIPVLGVNTLEVLCVDQNGNPMNKVRVFLQGIGSSEKPEDERSGKDGKAQFEKLPDDLYRVWAHEKEFESVYYEFIRLAGSTKEQVTLNFKPGDHEKLFYFEDPSVMDNAKNLMREGVQAIQGNQPEVARTKLNESIDIYPTNPDSFYNLAILNIQQGEWEPAKQNLAKTAELLDLFLTVSPDNSPMQQQRKNTQDLIDSMPLRQAAAEADEAMKARQWETAAEKLQVLSEMQPNNATVFYHWSIALTNLKKLDEADAMIDKAIAIEPDEDAFKQIKAQIAKRIEALEAEKIRIAMVIIQGLNSEGKHEEALAKIAESKDLFKDDLETLMWEEKAKAHLALEQHMDALTAFKIAYERQGKPVAESLFQLGQDFNRKGKQKEALQVYEFIHQEDPGFAEVYYELGMEYFYGSSQDKQKAKEMLEKYMEIGADEAHKSNAGNVLAVIEKS